MPVTGDSSTKTG